MKSRKKTAKMKMVMFQAHPECMKQKTCKMQTLIIDFTQHNCFQSLS